MQMCGISAIITLNDAYVDPRKVIEMGDLICHRGPDDEGYAFFHGTAGLSEFDLFGGNDTPDGIYQTNFPYSPKKKFSGKEYPPYKVLMGHRRLSIVDLSPAGHQPMSYADNRYWIVYNGEIYNYKELKEELLLLGHHFVSSSDTEVILAAYAQWGKECVHHFNGMWAFIIFDRMKGLIFVSRDRFGVKPLYYWYSRKGFIAFSSEVKQFTILPGWKFVINRPRAHDFLLYGITDHTSETLFQDVFQIRGGEALEFSIKDVPLQLPLYRWYEMKPTYFKEDFQAVTKHFKDLLFHSIFLRMRADVPLGSCLSGGLDSSSIVSVVHSILQETGDPALQKTFSACSHQKEYDERGFVDEIIESKNIESHCVYPELCDLFKKLDEIIWYQDEPFGSTSIFAQWNVFELAHQNNVIVMLDGQGADEILAGYHGFFQARYHHLMRRMQIFRLFRELTDARRIHGYDIAPELCQLLKTMLTLLVPMRIKKRMRQKMAFPPWIQVDDKEKNQIMPIPGLQNMNTTVYQFSFFQILYTNLPMLLHWEDRNSMAHSVESRVPFLDYRIVEYVLGLPEDFKISNGVTKVVLRSSMKGILPEKIRERMDKMGFITPEEVWMKEKDPELFKTELKKSINLSKGILNNRAEDELGKMIEGKRQFNFSIWRMICFGRWVALFS
jgi:asparagine synthase (glutamine-hydrolysing)